MSPGKSVSCVSVQGNGAWRQLCYICRSLTSLPPGWLVDLARSDGPKWFSFRNVTRETLPGTPHMNIWVRRSKGCFIDFQRFPRATEGLGAVTQPGPLPVPTQARPIDPRWSFIYNVAKQTHKAKLSQIYASSIMFISIQTRPSDLRYYFIC